MTIKTKIIALEYETAQTEITNKDLENILDTSDKWIYSRTGIKKRYILKDNETSTTLGIKAAKKVLEKIDFNPLNVDLIITASSAPEEIYPSVSCSIQAAIGAKNAACFDLKAACAGFVYSLKTAQAFIKSGMYENILIVATDATSKFTDWKDRSTCVLFGDGAGAVLLSKNEETENIIDIDLLSDGTLKDYITLTIKGSTCPLLDNQKEEIEPFIQMKGKEVYKYVMNEVPEKIENLLKRNNLKIKDIDYFVPHQSNQRMIEALAQRLELDNSKVISNIKNFGNMSATSTIAAIKEGVDNGKIKLPATILLSTFGAGMTIGNAIIKLDDFMLK